MLYFERKFERKGFDFIIGVDEAGRGPLAGPIVAGAVILGKRRFKARIFDSKKLTRLQREKAFFEIIDSSAYGIGIMNERVIDELNIQEANRLAMEHAIHGLMDRMNRSLNKGRVSRAKVCILIDGTIKLNIDFPCVNIIKGDSRCRSIAAASIVAKYTRDRIMCMFDKIYPQYKFFRHKGYPTSLHRKVLRQRGPTIIHRQTFLKCLKQD